MATRLRRATMATVVSLCRQRVRRRLGPRLAWLLAVGVALIFGAAGASVDEGGDPTTIVANALRWLCWLGAGPVALSVAAAPRARDRREGIADLAAIHGAGEGALTTGRLIAAALEASLRVVLPALLCCAVIVASGHRLGGVVVLAGVLSSGLMAGVVLGGLGAGCGAWAGERGRMALLAIVVLPWAIADQWAMATMSIPGALDAAIVFFVEGAA